MFAAIPGSAAAPTAGLHFTDELFGRLAAAGVGVAKVELVVGLDTFQPITTPDPLDHPMHTERYHVPESTPAGVPGRRAVSSPSAPRRCGHWSRLLLAARLSGRTNLFIHRGFDWQVVDLLMTNFHLPRTTLLMMIDAFVGDRWRRLYDEALAGDYRFLSFGDAMLLDRHGP